MKSYAMLEEAQHKAIDDLFEHDRRWGIMPMGFGKTVCALTAAEEIMSEGLVDLWLVVSTKHIAAHVWTTEAAEWDHLTGFEVKSLVGMSELERESAMVERVHMLCINFNHLPWLCKQKALLNYANRRIGLIIDETTRLKKANSVWSTSIKKLHRAADIRIVWGLTGTPNPNRHQEMYGQVTAIAGEEFWEESFTAWRARNFNRQAGSDYEYKIIPYCHDKMLEQIGKIAFTVSEDDMPAQTEPRVIDIEIPTPKGVLQVCKDLKKDGYIVLDGYDIEAANGGALTSKQHQLANGFIYANESVEVVDEWNDAEDPERVTIRFNTVKLDAVRELVEALQGDPLLVFYAFQADLEALRSAWPDLPTLGRGVSADQGAQYVRDWNAGKLPVLAMHPASAGHGLNMQAGGAHCCWYSIPYSNELYRQAIKRIARRGQERLVRVYRLIAGGTRDRYICDKVLAIREQIQDETRAALRSK